MRSMLRHLFHASLVTGLTLTTSVAFAAPIALQFGSVSVTGLSETSDADLGCPPELGCGGIPFTNIRVSISSITSVNPLLVELIDPFFDPGLTPEEQEFLSSQVEQIKERQDDVYRLWQQKTRELSSKRRPRGSSITLPDDPEDPVVLEIEYEGTGLLPPYLIFSVTDSITGESVEQLIRVVPEPSTLLCLGAGLAAAGVRQYRRQRRSGAA